MFLRILGSHPSYLTHYGVFYPYVVIPALSHDQSSPHATHFYCKRQTKNTFTCIFTLCVRTNGKPIFKIVTTCTLNIWFYFSHYFITCNVRSPYIFSLVCFMDSWRKRVVTKNRQYLWLLYENLCINMYEYTMLHYKTMYIWHITSLVSLII